MKQLNTLKNTKRRGIFLALLLLMAMPMAAQTTGSKFDVGDLRYEVLNAANHTVKVIPKENYLQLTDDYKKIKPAYFGQLSGVIDLTQPIMYNNINWKLTEIGERAFQLEDITEVKLPDGVTRIGLSAFYKTTLLRKINFPASLKAIEKAAFYESGLTEVNIPGSTAIGSDAFLSCVNMEKLSIPNVTYMGYRCFFHCSKLGSVTVPKSAKLGNSPDASLKDYNLTITFNVTSGHHAFADCYNLKTATIEDGVTTVTDGMFEYCSELVKLTIPASVKSIESYAFRQCFNLRSIDIKEVESIGEHAFWLCDNLKGDLVLSHKVKNIGYSAFGGTRFTGVKWEGTDGCTIDGSAFTDCNFLEYLDLHTLQSPKLKTRQLGRHDNNKDNFANGLLSRTIVYLPQGVDFTFSEGEDVNFVKSDGSGNFTCTKLSVQDGADYEFPIQFTAKEAVYNKWVVDKEVGPGQIGNDIIEYPDRHAYYVDDYRIYETDYNDGHIMPLASYRDFSDIKDGKNCFTMLLPYAVNVPTGFRAYELEYRGTYKTPVQGENTYNEYYLFSSIDGNTLEANKPYLLRITDGQEHTSKDIVAAANVQIAASGTDKIDDSGNDVTTQPSTSAIHNYINTGTLKPQGFFDTKTGQSYKFVGGTERLNNHLAANLNTWLLNTDGMGIDVWRKVEWEEEFIPIPGTDMIVPPTPVTAAPFRGYIQPIDNTVPAKPFVILTDDEAAAIDSLEQGTPLTGEQGIYTLDGRYAGNDLKALPSGIYVIKGKKIAK